MKSNHQIHLKARNVISANPVPDTTRPIPRKPRAFLTAHCSLLTSPWLRRSPRPFLLLTMLMLSALPALSARASTLDALLADLAGGDDVARSRARALLPREDVAEAVPKLVALVQRDDATVWRAAFNVLMDVAAEVSAPGREQEQLLLTAHVLTLVAPGQSPGIQNRGLRLLPFVVPEDRPPTRSPLAYFLNRDSAEPETGQLLEPLAILLAGQDARIAEKARAALFEIGTTEARQILRERLDQAAPEMQCAILDALGRLKDAEALSKIETLCKSPDARVRAAAARASAWTGDPFRLAAARQVVAQADDATRVEATDALLRLVNAIEEHGGNWEIVVSCYKELVAGSSGVFQDAALAGLGRIGDGTCVAPVLAALEKAAPPTSLVGLAALRQMGGVDVTRAVVEAYPRQPEPIRLGLLDVLGSKKHALTLPILIEAARSKDPAFRLAGLQALAESEQGEALAVLIEAGRTGSDPEKAVASAGVLKLAHRLRAANKLKEAGLAYVAAMESPGNDEARRAILEGLAACPVAEALPALRKSAENKPLAGITARALVATAKALAGAGRKEDAVSALELARSLDASPEMARQILLGLRDAGAAGDYAAMLGLITNWAVVGPFELGEDNAGWDKTYIGEPNDVSLTAKYMSGKRRLEWAAAPAPDERGVIDLHRAFGPGDHKVGYARVEIAVEKDTPAMLLLGVDDSERVWINGEKVHELFVARAIVPDQDAIPIQLKAGGNVILVKIWQNLMGWEFCARLTTPDGKPLAFTQKGK